VTDKESLRRQARELIKNRPLGGPLFGEYKAKIEYAEEDELGERE